MPLSNEDNINQLRDVGNLIAGLASTSDCMTAHDAISPEAAIFPHKLARVALLLGQDPDIDSMPSEVKNRVNIELNSEWGEIVIRIMAPIAIVLAIKVIDINYKSAEVLEGYEIRMINASEIDEEDSYEEHYDIEGISISRTISALATMEVARDCMMLFLNRPKNLK